MTRPAELFGRFALRLLGPGPAEARLVNLAKLYPTALPVVPICKSRFKLWCWSAIFLAWFLLLAALDCGVFATGRVGFVWIGLLLSILLFGWLFKALQLALVATCKQPPLILDAEGLRVNFTGDFIRYDQIARVRYSRYNTVMLIKLAPGVEMAPSGVTYGFWCLIRTVALCAVYEDQIGEIGDEIERRMKIAAPGRGARQEGET